MCENKIRHIRVNRRALVMFPNEITHECACITGSVELRSFFRYSGRQWLTSFSNQCLRRAYTSIIWIFEANCQNPAFATYFATHWQHVLKFWLASFSKRESKFFYFHEHPLTLLFVPTCATTHSETFKATLQNLTTRTRHSHQKISYPGGEKQQKIIVGKDVDDIVGKAS